MNNNIHTARVITSTKIMNRNPAPPATHGITRRFKLASRFRVKNNQLMAPSANQTAMKTQKNVGGPFDFIIH